MNEFEAVVLLGQLAGAMERWRRRNENAAYLTARLKDIPGLTPQKLYPGTESGSFYLYTMSYHKEHFDGVSRATFLKAMNAEGIGLSPYIEQGLHKEPWIDQIVNSKSYQRMYSAERLRQFSEQRACPKCDQVCEEMVMLWASGPLLAPQEEVADVADAIEKVWENRAQLKQV
jgi:dTDP-4-amino-4,6-dideoxygalactose transaminase